MLTTMKLMMMLQLQMMMTTIIVMVMAAAVVVTIFQLGIEGGVPMRVEIFAQLMKQCNQNPSQDSKEKAWGLMMLCFLHFPPGEAMENTVQTFIRDYCPVATRDMLIKQCHKSACASPSPASMRLRLLPPSPLTASLCAGTTSPPWHPLR
jgi:hypothetical protein